MEIFLTLGCVVVFVFYLRFKSIQRMNKELDTSISHETSDLRIESKSELKLLLSSFNYFTADYLKILRNEKGDWYLKTRGYIKGSSYSVCKLAIIESNSAFTFKILKLEINQSNGKLMISKKYWNKVWLTFKINNEGDYNVLKELKNTLK